MNQLPRELLNAIADFLDTPSVVMFRMANTSIRNKVSMKAFNRPKQWRGRFFIKFCEKLKYDKLIEYAENCGLKYIKLKKVIIRPNRRISEPTENIGPYLNYCAQDLSMFDFTRKFQLTKENLEIMANWSRKNSLNTAYFSKILMYQQWTNSLENITFINDIFCPDWRRLELPKINVVNADVARFIISKGRADILDKSEIIDVIKINTCLSDWMFYFSNNLINMGYEDTCECPTQPFEFPMAENLESNINHLVSLKIKIPIDVVFLIVSSGEHNILNKILTLEYITSSNVDYLIENFEEVKINLYGKAPFDRTLYNEIMEILIGHRQRLGY